LTGKRNEVGSKMKKSVGRCERIIRGCKTSRKRVERSVVTRTAMEERGPGQQVKKMQETGQAIKPIVIGGADPGERGQDASLGV